MEHRRTAAARSQSSGADDHTEATDSGRLKDLDEKKFDHSEIGGLRIKRSSIKSSREKFSSP